MNQRLKGHTFERRIAKFYRESMGFPRAKTTRSCSRQLDACGIDIIGTTWLSQCKSGYSRSRPKFEEEYRYVKDRIVENFGADHRLNNYPVVLLHELDVGAGNKRLEEHTYVSITLTDFRRLLIDPPTEIIDII